MHHADSEGQRSREDTGVANANNIGAGPLERLQIQERVAKLTAQTS
jgi:hypothetical protein